MKKIITDFLFKRRFKVLKNKKGFSLLEVLVAVGIIAIISAIAVPQFTANKEEAAKVAGVTSVTNIEKAYKHCTALKSHADCDTLEDLKVTCPDCKGEVDSGNTKFCAQIEKSSGGKTFRACVDFESGDTVGVSYGGDLLGKVKLCHYARSSCTTGSDNLTKAVVTGARECTADSQCTSGAVSKPGCTYAYSCALIDQSKGVCSGGVCSR